MDLTKLQIHSQQGKTGLSISRPSMSISQTQANMDIKQNIIGSLRISTTASKLFIDQTEAFADAGVVSSLQSAYKNSAAASQSVSQYIAKTVSQGEQLKRIEHGGNVISNIAKVNGERPAKEVGLGFVPKTAFKVRFNYQPSQVNIQVESTRPTIRFQTNDPVIHIPRWETSVYMQQKNAISFSVVGGNVNKQL